MKNNNLNSVAKTSPSKADVSYDEDFKCLTRHLLTLDLTEPRFAYKLKIPCTDLIFKGYGIITFTRDEGRDSYAYCKTSDDTVDTGLIVFQGDTENLYLSNYPQPNKKISIYQRVKTK